MKWRNGPTIIYCVLADPSIAALDPLERADPEHGQRGTQVTNTGSVLADGGGTALVFNRGTWSELVTNR